MSAQRLGLTGGQAAMDKPLGQALSGHRAMLATDLDRVMALEVQAYSHPWSRGNFLDSLQAGYHAELRLDTGGSLLAYWVAMAGVDELHLLNITVAPAHQRQGHGRALVRRVIALAGRLGHPCLLLEVRQGNLAALALYRSLGFAQMGLRRDYYPAGHGREDAVVMRLDGLAGAASDALD